MNLKPEYTAFWLGFLLLVLVGEFYWHGMFAVALPYGLLLEGVALRRRKVGDTGSEHVWSFLFRDDGTLLWARVPLVTGFIVLMANGLYELGAGPVEVWGLDVGRAGLAAGFAGWFVAHAIYRGRHG